MASDRPPLILHVVNSLQGGGTERALLRLLQAFNPDRARHALVTLRSAGKLAERLPDHVACWPIEAQGRSRRAGLSLRRIVNLWKPAVVHARNTGCWFDALLATAFKRQVSVLLGFHGLDHAGPMTPRQARVVKWGLRSGARFTSVAFTGQERLQKEAGIPPRQCCVIPTGIDPSQWPRITAERRSAARRQLRLPERARVIGTVGSFTPVKRLDLMIELVHRLRDRVPDLHVVLIGDGPLRERLLQRSRELGLTDRVCSPGMQENTANLLAALDVYVCPSDSEALSNALLEAMAAGLPVVSTDVGDHARLVRHERDGLIVPVHDIETLAKRIEALLSCEPERARLSSAARLRAADYTFARTIEAYEQLYETRSMSRGRDSACQLLLRSRRAFAFDLG